MNSIRIAGLGVVLSGILSCAVMADEAGNAMKMPEPKKEHQWLQQMVGEWESEGEIMMEPGKPPIKSRGTQVIKPLGGFWVISEDKGKFMDQDFTGIMTLGYDTDQQKFVGTWVDSMNHHLWTYEGTVDSTGKILTLEANGPCPMKPGKRFRFREVLEIKNQDHKVFTSSMQGEDGKWMTNVTMNYRRKK